MLLSLFTSHSEWNFISKAHEHVGLFVSWDIFIDPTIIGSWVQRMLSMNESSRPTASDFTGTFVSDSQLVLFLSSCQYLSWGWCIYVLCFVSSLYVFLLYKFFGCALRVCTLLSYELRRVTVEFGVYMYCVFLYLGTYCKGVVSL